MPVLELAEAMPESLRMAAIAARRRLAPTATLDQLGDGLARRTSVVPEVLRLTRGTLRRSIPTDARPLSPISQCAATVRH